MNSIVLELVKKKPYHPLILNGLAEQLTDKFQMSEVVTNIEVPIREHTAL